MIDLHCHSTYSDGRLSVKALYDKAIENQLQMLALTDHDTIDGVNELKALALSSSINIISGIELSVRFKTKDIHVLGLNISTDAKAIQSLVGLQKAARNQRAKEIAAKLEKLGVERAYEKACEIAGHEHITRPHFAELLTREGKCRDMQDAFKKYLARGRPAFAPTKWASIEEAVGAISESGGVAVIAHPLKYGLTQTKLLELIRVFKEAGGAGLEVVSGDVGQDDILKLAGLCHLFELYASSGSDFHGNGPYRYDLGKQPSLPKDCRPIWALF